ncbi:cytidine deaminase [Sphingobium sufflavum]|uniref:cytidine deaminase n=1 Tax=Sphingobium sufflavum TaxID=1129547 RepID=UPI001F246CD0|nr:cytidine deaminase [Sphingobium sufflavum]MCE7797619.1 cytidine deaminase [Sphingobium sufflavum]
MTAAVPAVDVAALLEEARTARGHAYAPYSGFTVGAAIALDDGTVVRGANVENASYGLSLCAEAVALASAHASGVMGRALALAVVGDSASAPSGVAVTPCGRCRQMLVEAEHVAGRALAIHSAPASASGLEGAVRHAVADLLPHAFGPGNL